MIIEDIYFLINKKGGTYFFNVNLFQIEICSYIEKGKWSKIRYNDTNTLQINLNHIKTNKGIKHTYHIFSIMERSYRIW